MVNVRDFGAVGDGVTDDRVAIQAALAAGAGGTVIVPPGTYLVSRAGNAYYSLSVPPGTKLQGSTAITGDVVLLQAPGTAPSVRVLQLDAPGVEVSFITLDGNKAAQTPDEHRAGVFVAAKGCRLTNVTARNFTGDGIYLYSASDGAVLYGCLVEGNDRNGITLGGLIDGVEMYGCTARGNGVQQIDMEPGAGNSVHDVTIRGCTITAAPSNDFALTISGSSSAAWSSGVLVTDCTIDGAVNVVWANDVTIRANRGTNTTTKACVTVYQACDGVVIEGNDFELRQNTIDGLGVIAITGTGTGWAPSRVRVANNRLVASVRPRTMGVRVDGAVSVAIDDNELVGTGFVAAGYPGVYLHATVAARPFQSAIVRRNRIRNFGSHGVMLLGNGNARLEHAVIQGNTFDDTTSSMTIAMSLDDGTGAAKAIDLSDNVLLGGCVTAVSRYPAGVPILVAGQRGCPGAVMVTP